MPVGQQDKGNLKATKTISVGFIDNVSTILKELIPPFGKKYDVKRKSILLHANVFTI